MSDNDGCHATATVGRGGVAVLRARFRMPLSEEIWATAVTTSFPDATLRLLTGVPMDDRALELGEVRADDPRAVVDAIETHPDITAYESLFVGDDRAIGQYEAAEQSLYEFLWGSSLPPEFPIVVADGVMEFDVTATREQFEAFGDALDANGREYDLLSVVHTDASGGLLTDRQRECLTVALREGYFEVPRRCPLAEVANVLGVDKSTASETIRRAVARVLAQFLLGEQT